MKFAIPLSILPSEELLPLTIEASIVKGRSSSDGSIDKGIANFIKMTSIQTRINLFR